MNKAGFPVMRRSVIIKVAERERGRNRRVKKVSFFPIFFERGLLTVLNLVYEL